MSCFACVSLCLKLLLLPVSMETLSFLRKRLLRRDFPEKYYHWTINFQYYICIRKWILKCSYLLILGIILQYWSPGCEMINETFCRKYLLLMTITMNWCGDHFISVLCYRYQIGSLWINKRFDRNYSKEMNSYFYNTKKQNTNRSLWAHEKHSESNDKFSF